MRRSRGATLAELAVALAVAGTIGLTVAGLFRAGAVSARYTVRQADVLQDARLALEGDGSLNGLIPSIRAASAVSALSASSLGLVPAAGGSLQFSVQSYGLARDPGTGNEELAGGVSGLAVRYFGVDGAGLPYEVSAASAAALVSVQVTLTPSSGRSYRFLSAARLRNAP